MDYRPGFPVESDDAFAFQEKIDFLAHLMEVVLSGASFGEAGFGEALELDGGVGPIQDASNRGTVFCRKRSLCFEVFNDHNLQSI